MTQRHIILTKQEAEAVNKSIKNNNNGVLDKFKYGGWTVTAEQGKLKDGTFAMSRELIDESEKRGGANATKIGGVDLKNKTDVEINDNQRVKNIQ